MKGPLPESITELGYLRRRLSFQDFVVAISFAQLQRLDNTISSIDLTLTDDIQNQLQLSKNFYIGVAHTIMIHCNIMVDPARVIYTTADQVHRDIQDLGMLDASCLQNTECVESCARAWLFQKIVQIPHPSNVMPIVITQFLLEYSPGESLEQITSNGLVQKGRTHLDIKPSSTISGAKENAMLIDIS
ncbi:hypothetical protein N7540_004169 [Penicillium herquei]|nr:hypothetical protein N7540_004169 [Penicillium herquei]